MMRPEADQMPSACKNWFSVGRWADVSNAERGITWVTLDAPLVEVGAVTANLLNSQHDPNTWRKTVDRTQKLYSWALNNHWHTNYRAYQEGPLVFRFVLRPHQKTTPGENSQFATRFSQPLVTAPSRGGTRGSLLRVEPASVLVSALKPSDDGKGLIVRLIGTSANDVAARLQWDKPRELWLSDTSEKPLQKVTGNVTVPAQGVVTLRVE
jgi:alpha-mannosidase